MAIVATVALLVGSVGPAGAQDDSDKTDRAEAGADGAVTLTLLHNNDGESKLLPVPDRGFPGIARFAQKLQDLGTASRADILLRVTSGDNFLASKTFAAGLGDDGAPIDAVALSGLYEVMGLGNHDFDFGPELTARFIGGFEPPVSFVAANIDVSAEPSLAALSADGLVAPSVVVTDPDSGLEVGVIGAITPRLSNISSPRGVTVDADVAGAVNTEAARLIDSGIDRIVLVSHLQSLDADRNLVPELSGVDIVVAGGGDELLKNDGDSCLADEPAAGPYPLVLTDADGADVPVVTAPGGYRCIGRLEITFDASGDVVDWTGGSIAVDVDGRAETYAVETVETPLLRAIVDIEETVIARTEIGLDGRKPAVRSMGTNLGELLASSVLHAAQDTGGFGGDPAQVAILNGGGIRNDSVIPPGDLTLADTFDIAPFTNFVTTVEVPRPRLKELLEGTVAGLPDSEGAFPQIAGFTLDVDPTAPARVIDRDGDCSASGQGERIRSLTLADGTEIVRDGAVVDGDPVTLATLSFLATGGDCYPLGDLESTTLGTTYQQALADFIVDELAGRITADEWPSGGSNLMLPGDGGPPPEETFPGDESDDASNRVGADRSTGDDASADDDVADDSEASAEGTEPDDGAEQASSEDLPRTGLDTWMWSILAATVIAGGAMVWHESRLGALRSLRTRLVTTRAWSPETRPGRET